MGGWVELSGGSGSGGSSGTTLMLSVPVDSPEDARAPKRDAAERP
ncbi:MAG: hypothetical protein U1F49_15495 [Rubrivivax sp.]